MHRAFTRGKRRGWEPFISHDGDTLMEWVRAGKGDVVITDVRMPISAPHKNGIDLLPDIIKARPDLPLSSSARKIRS